MHTPTPWNVNVENSLYGLRRAWTTDSHPTRRWISYIHQVPAGTATVGSVLGETEDEAIANAELIVKCVNAHDALVAALEAANEAFGELWRLVNWDCVEGVQDDRLEAKRMAVLAALQKARP